MIYIFGAQTRSFKYENVLVEKCYQKYSKKDFQQNSFAKFTFIVTFSTFSKLASEFNPTFIKLTIPSYILHSRLNQLVHLQNTYHILSNERQISSDILPSFSKACKHLIASIFPLLTLLERDKNGKGKSSNNILYDRIDVYLSSNVNRIMFAEYFLF